MAVMAVAERLGGRRTLGRELKSDGELIAAIREGFPAAALDHVIDAVSAVTGTQQFVYEAVGSTRTLQRKRSQRTRLSSDESDRLARLARLLVRAEESLGDRERGYRWLAAPNRALDGEVPLALLDSDAGALAVERILTRIEHGIYG